MPLYALHRLHRLPCADTGQNCVNDIYALSLPSETPSAFISWFQAQEACANADKEGPGPKAG